MAYFIKLGKKVANPGKIITIMHVTIKVIQKGTTPRNTFIGGTFVIEAVTRLTTPTGGVNRPMLSMRTVKTPNQIPLYPNVVMIG